MNNYYPSYTSTAVAIKGILKNDKPLAIVDRMSTRMVKCAAELPGGDFLGWQMVIPKDNLVEMSLFGSASLADSDLKWIAEKAVSFNEETIDSNLDTPSKLYELRLSVQDKSSNEIGFGSLGSASSKESSSHWPIRWSAEFSELIRILRETGAIFRVVLGSASSVEQSICRKEVMKTWNVREFSQDEYVGHPVHMRVLLALPGNPSIRLKSILRSAIPGITLEEIRENITAIWESPLSGSPVLPDVAARILIMEPDLQEDVIGIERYDVPVPPIAASHKDTSSEGSLTIGKAIGTSGLSRDIKIGDMDLRRHYQIVGQTGTGKSTLLAGIILSAIQQGHGLTFFDPHGTTIDTILPCIPPEYAHKVRVVRIGDAEHPVPLNIWDSDDPEKEERNISDLCELFSDIFDPNREGFVGPRYERWLATFAKASIALLGRRASLESIAILSQNQSNMRRLHDILHDEYPDLTEIIKEEYGKDQSSDFHNLLGWFLCKFQRLTSVEQLRKTLGAGTNALDFNHTIDTDTVTLIDLASPSIGTHAARIIGTLMMMKLWNAAMQRDRRDLLHMVVVDEASLFQTNPMPRMLAESRKFGLSMVLCHQHAGQLTREVRDALEANSANFSAFRLSPRDASVAAMRFDNADMEVNLSRLDAFQAITTISVDGRQTAPFTLMVDHPEELPDGDQIAQQIEQHSIATLVKPYQSLQALTPAEINEILRNPESLQKYKAPAIPDRPSKIQNGHEPHWLQQWEIRRQQLLEVG